MLMHYEHEDSPQCCQSDIRSFCQVNKLPHEICMTGYPPPFLLQPRFMLRPNLLTEEQETRGGQGLVVSRFNFRHLCEFKIND